MPGIVGIINNKKIIKKLEENNSETINENIEFNDVFLARSTLPKFLNDKVFFETKNNIFLLEGVVFNIKELIKKYNQKNWHETLIKMSIENNESFFNEFRGSFSGFFYDKIENKSIIFTDHIGDKPIYYYENDGELVFASEINSIIKLLKKNNIEYTLDERGAYSLLTHGYMLEDLTPFNEIKRLKAGCRIKVDNTNQYSIERYHLLSNVPNDNLSDKEIIDKIDDLFQQAMRRQTSKNKEYEYKDVAPLSAGLDSRMTTWVLSQQVKDILNVTYSQSNYLDEIIPKEISAELKIHLLFKTLDNGLSLFYLDEMVQRNSGIVIYGGPAQVWDTFHLLDQKDIGVIHTGMLGDVVVGTFYKSLEREKAFNIDDGIYSSFLIDGFKKILVDYKVENYKNQEIFNFYNRGFNGANMGSPLVFQEFTESYSPFYDIDFLEFCLTIPVEKRWKYNIYDKWVLEKYPDAAKYAHNGRKISKNKGKNLRLFGKDITVEQLRRSGFKYLMKKVGLNKNNMETPNHMNPFDYWYNTNQELKIYMDDYFNDYLFKINNNDLYQDVSEMYEQGSTMEKTQVLTLLSIVKNYFYSTEWLND